MFFSTLRKKSPFSHDDFLLFSNYFEEIISEEWKRLYSRLPLSLLLSLGRIIRQQAPQVPVHLRRGLIFRGPGLGMTIPAHQTVHDLVVGDELRRAMEGEHREDDVSHPTCLNLAPVVEQTDVVNIRMSEIRRSGVYDTAYSLDKLESLRLTEKRRHLTAMTFSSRHDKVYRILCQTTDSE